MKKIKSGFALLDVLGKDGKLKKRIEKGDRIPVVIKGTITHIHGNHDGTSREYGIEVTEVES